MQEAPENRPPEPSRLEKLRANMAKARAARAAKYEARKSAPPTCDIPVTPDVRPDYAEAIAAVKELQAMFVGGSPPWALAEKALKLLGNDS